MCNRNACIFISFILTENLIQTRIIPPVFTGGIVRRKRLLSLLNKNIDKSLILICSSAGFGKTTLVQDFITHSKFKYSWYYVTPDINNFYTFFTYIVHSFIRLSGSFGEKSLAIIDAIKKDTVLSRDYKSSINDISATFLNEFYECFKENVTLVLDDLHNINEKENSEWLNYLFNVLFDNMPQNLHIIITSRDVPGFNLSKLKAKRRIFQLGTRELVFDRDEIIALLENVYSIDYTGDDVEILQSNISGWITGIHLILQAYGKDIKQVKLGDLLNYDDIFNYFANEIFNELPGKTKEFLLSTALLEDFDREICEHLLKINNSEQIINDLLNRNIFIHRSSISKQGKSLYSYNYQELFKFFLLTKLRELKTDSEINTELNKLFAYYLKRNDIIKTVNYGLQAKNYESVIPIIIYNFNRLFEKGNFHILWEWIITIPDEIVSSDSSLLYHRGKLYFYLHSNPEKSIEYLDKALSLTGQDKDVSLVINCWILKMESLLLTGKYQGLRTELLNLLNLNISAVERAKVLYAVSKVSYREGHSKYNEMIEILEEALNICNEQNLHSLKTDIFRMLGIIYSDWGDMVKTIHFLEQALSIDTDVYKIFRAINNVINSYCSLGNYSKAKVYLDKAKEMYNSYPSLLFKRFLLRGKGQFRFECGDFEESIKNYQELIDLEFKNNIKHYAANGFLLIGESNYYLRNYDSAVKNFEIAMDHVDEGNEYYKLLILYLKKKLSVRTVLESDTEKILINALDFHEKHNIILQKAQIEFNLADYYLRSEMEESALKYLKDCLKVSSEKQYVSFLEQEILNSRSVFDFAVSHPELSEYRKFIRILFDNLRQRLDFNWYSDKCRKRLTQQIKELDDIRMNTFGKLEFKLRGKPIPEAKWTRKKSRLILAYLLAEPNRVLTKDKIVDEFLQDTPPEKVDAVYHNTLSNMRTALKVEYDFQNKSGKKSSKSKASEDWSPNLLLYEGKTLRWNTDFYYWSDCAEFEKLYNSAMSSSAEPKLKLEHCIQAAELYKGDFLPGYYESWCEEMRQNYSNMFIKLCYELIKTYKEKKSYSEIIKYAEKILKIDKLNDDAYVEMIEAYSRLGETNMAKDKFSLMLKIYDEELGEKPENSVLDMINQIFT